MNVRTVFAGTAILVLVLVLVAGVAMRNLTAAGEPVYSVAQVLAGAARHPQAWRGRTVRVQGAIVWYSYSSPPTVIRAPITGPFKGRVLTWSGVPINSQGQVGCFGTARTCRQTIAAHLATVPPGDVVYAALASHPRHIGAVTLFTLPLRVIRYPADTLVVAFRMPAAPDPIALAWLRHIPILGDRLPRPLLNAMPPSGVYRLSLFMGARSASSQPQHGLTRDGALLGG